MPQGPNRDAFHRRRTGGAARRYALLATTLLALNHLLLSGLAGLGPALLPAKVLTELALVSTSFAAQRSFVFRTTPDGPTTGQRTTSDTFADFEPATPGDPA